MGPEGSGRAARARRARLALTRAALLTLALVAACEGSRGRGRGGAVAVDSTRSGVARARRFVSGSATGCYSVPLVRRRTVPREQRSSVACGSHSRARAYRRPMPRLASAAVDIAGARRHTWRCRPPSMFYACARCRGDAADSAALRRGPLGSPIRRSSPDARRAIALFDQISSRLGRTARHRTRSVADREIRRAHAAAFAAASTGSLTDADRFAYASALVAHRRVGPGRRSLRARPSARRRLRTRRDISVRGFSRLAGPRVGSPRFATSQQRNDSSARCACFCSPISRATRRRADASAAAARARAAFSSQQARELRALRCSADRARIRGRKSCRGRAPAALGLLAGRKLLAGASARRNG